MHSKRERAGRLISILLMVAGFLTAFSALAQKSPDPMLQECSPASIRQTERRVFDSQGRMRTIIYAQDAFDVLRCVSAGRKREALMLEAALFSRYEHRTCLVSSAKMSECMRNDDNSFAVVKIATYIRPICDNPNLCLVEYFVQKDGPQLQSAQKPFGKSGGLPFAFLLGHTGALGHYEITRRALAGSRSPGNVVPTAKAADILSDASRDADFYEWLTPAAHAQADMSSSGELIEDADKALISLFKWTGARLKIVREKCASNNIREAVYLLGYALHGIQDFVFHEGMSNAEHSWRDQVEKKPVDSDWRYPEKLALATFATSEFLTAFAQKFAAEGYGSCVDAMYGWSGAGELYFWEKRRTLEKSTMDLSVEELFKFRKIGNDINITHMCTDCDSSKKARVILQGKWLGWYAAESESTMEKLQHKITNYVKAMFLHK